MEFESPGTVPFQDFMLLDMAARYPGLLPDGVLPGPPKAFQAGDVARATARANAFVEWLHQRFKTPDALAPGYAKGHGPQALVSSSQLASCLPGRFVSQEVGNVMLGYACRLLGIDFLEDVNSVVSSVPWPELRAYTRSDAPRYLVLAKHIPDAVRKFLADGYERVLNKYSLALSQALRNYDGSSMTICGSMHYRAVSLKRVLGVNDSVEIQGTVTDSCGASACAGK